MNERIQFSLLLFTVGCLLVRYSASACGYKSHVQCTNRHAMFSQIILR